MIWSESLDIGHTKSKEESNFNKVFNFLYSNSKETIPSSKEQLIYPEQPIEANQEPSNKIEEEESTQRRKVLGIPINQIPLLLEGFSEYMNKLNKSFNQFNPKTTRRGSLLHIRSWLSSQISFRARLMKISF